MKGLQKFKVTYLVSEYLQVLLTECTLNSGSTLMHKVGEHDCHENKLDHCERYMRVVEVIVFFVKL